MKGCLGGSLTILPPPGLYRVCLNWTWVTEDSHIDFKRPVHPDIVKRAEYRLGTSIPQKVTVDGKDFRKYLAKALGN